MARPVATAGSGIQARVEPAAVSAEPVCFVCSFLAPNRLYLNQGDGTFMKRASTGLDYVGASVMMAFSDYNLDGHLDGFLLTNRRLPLDDKKPMPSSAIVMHKQPSHSDKMTWTFSA